MKVLILGIGNILFGDEGVGPHLANLIEEKYSFSSTEHEVDVIDGGTLAQRLIPIITEYDRVVIIDCVKVAEGDIGDVYSFNFDDMPEYITWDGSAHEVEMLQTLNMMVMIGDRPPTKIVGIIPKVVNETTLSLTDAVKKGSELMEKIFPKHIKELGFEYKIKKDLDIQSVADKACTQYR